MDTDPGRYLVRVTERVLPPPTVVWTVLADPRRHPEIDGSGSVVDTVAPPERLSVGASFDMRMRRGFPYVTRNTVVDLEPERVLAWSTRPLTRPLRWLIGGRVWRYELEPDGEGTAVTATWDLRPERNRALVRPLAGNPGADLVATIRRLEELTRSDPPAPS